MLGEIRWGIFAVFTQSSYLNTSEQSESLENLTEKNVRSRLSPSAPPALIEEYSRRLDRYGANQLNVIDRERRLLASFRPNANARLLRARIPQSKKED